MKKHMALLSEDELNELWEAACRTYRNTEVRVTVALYHHEPEGPPEGTDLRPYDELTEGEKAFYRIKLLPVHKVYAEIMGCVPPQLELPKAP